MLQETKRTIDRIFKLLIYSTSWEAEEFWTVTENEIMDRQAGGGALNLQFIEKVSASFGFDFSSGNSREREIKIE